MSLETDRENNQDQLIEYLYGEIAPEEKFAFKNLLGKDPQLSGDLKNYLQLRQLFQEHLPKAKAPNYLCDKILRDLGVKRPWYGAFFQSYWQPALAGAFVLMLTLGISYTWKRVEQGAPPTVADGRGTPSASVPAVTPRVIGGRSVQEIGDSFLVNASTSPQLRIPLRRTFPTNPFVSQNPQVTLAGYGQPYSQPMMEGSAAGIPTAEVQNLQMEADMSMAQLHHQQALRLRGMGDFKAAAHDLGRLIKDYPFYPLKYQAMAQRVDCLFRAGEAGLAKQELRVLQSISPNLAYLLEQRWTGIQ